MKHLFLTLLTLGFMGTLFGQFSMSELYKSETLTNSMGETLPARLWHKYEPKDKPVPLVILLHGSGECGVDNAKQLSIFSALHKLQIVSDQPALYMVPQCSAQNAWVRSLAFQPDYRQPRYPAPSLRTIKEEIERLINDGIVDEDRVYLIGISLGAFGVWDAIQRWPNTFAAAVPICGGGSVQPEAIKNATTTNLWIFHGALDTNVSVECSRRLVEALKKEGTIPRYTEYEKSAHNIWGTALSNKELYTWLFKQRRGKHIDALSEESDSFFSALFDQLIDYVTPGK